MDQDLAWWAHTVLDGWRDRPGPRYQRLAAAVVDAVDRGTVRGGARLPAERVLAEALGVSRGTVVAGFEQLAAAGLVERRQGAGTFVVGRPAWTRQPADNPAAALLMRRFAQGGDAVDLSLSVPAGLDHLPPLDWAAVAARLDGHGLDPAGLPALREAIAAHLSSRQGIPTEPGEVVVTAGAQQALTLLAAALVG